MRKREAEWLSFLREMWSKVENKRERDRGLGQRRGEKEKKKGRKKERESGWTAEPGRNSLKERRGRESRARVEKLLLLLETLAKK